MRWTGCRAGAARRSSRPRLNVDNNNRWTGERTSMDRGGFDRRSLIGLAAGAAALGAAGADAAPARKAGKAAAKGARFAPGAAMPGGPTPSKVVPTRAGKVQGLVQGGIGHYLG